MAKGIHKFTGSGRQKKPILSWIAGAWQDIPDEMIESSFLKCGITNSLDGTDDDVISSPTMIPTANLMTCFCKGTFFFNQTPSPSLKVLTFERCGYHSLSRFFY